MQRVEILKIVDSPPMIEPSQVVVNKAQVLVADPIVTPFEMLRQKVNIRSVVDAKVVFGSACTMYSAYMYAVYLRYLHS